MNGTYYTDRDHLIYILQAHLDAEFSIVDVVVRSFNSSSGLLKHDSVGQRIRLKKAQPRAPLDDVAVS